MPDGSTHPTPAHPDFQAQAREFFAAEDHYFARTLEWAARRTDLRQPSADELRLLTEARAAHATFPAPMWEAYFSGSAKRFLMQFEGTYAGLMADDRTVVEACDRQAAIRDAFLDRLIPGGDLYEVVQAIDAANVARALGIAA